MRHIVDAHLREEARAFDLKFACCDCVHFDAPRDVCVHGYIERPSPSDMDRLGAQLAFCKEFELGGEDEP
jgi:hypothetical protein